MKYNIQWLVPPSAIKGPADKAGYQIIVHVTDKNNNPVKGLTKNDFRVTTFKTVGGYSDGKFDFKLEGLGTNPPDYVLETDNDGVPKFPPDPTIYPVNYILGLYAKPNQGAVGVVVSVDIFSWSHMMWCVVS